MLSWLHLTGSRGMCMTRRRPGASPPRWHGLYTNWLVDSRQIAVSVDRAGRAAGSPEDFAAWWRALDDEVHRFFREQRNLALKEVAEVIASRCIVVDEHGRQLAYWAFPEGPHAGDPLVPRCQQYTEWLYRSVIAPASELLHPWTLRERQDEPFVLFG
jgi:hypothetical protein